jgi:uncharacterized repeat protein (TIGR03837 family)
MLWDIFCRVIDNHGDAGVCWRLAAQLAARRHAVRLRIDDASSLRWMAPDGASGVEVLPWDDSPDPGDVVIEAFGCELSEGFQARIASAAQSRPQAPAWVNLEYLTAEPFAARNHGLPSPVMAGPAKGLAKRFFYPGFTPGTGGLLREPDLQERQSAFDRQEWLRSRGIPWRGQRLVSLFCYEPERLADLLRQLASGPPTTLLVTAGRAAEAVRKALPGAGGTDGIEWLPLMSQREFDHLLWSCDFNFVRGEDSLVRALWAGRPFCWQLYPQDDCAHHAKLEAFLAWLQPEPAWSALFRAWNGTGTTLPPLDAAGWLPAAQEARGRLLREDDLVTQLEGFVMPAHEPASTSPKVPIIP